MLDSGSRLFVVVVVLLGWQVLRIEHSRLQLGTPVVGLELQHTVLLGSQMRQLRVVDVLLRWEVVVQHRVVIGAQFALQLLVLEFHHLEVFALFV